MARVDVDRITILSTTIRNGVIELELDWFDANGASKGRHTISWGSEQEARKLLDTQSIEDVLRTLLQFLCQRADGSFRRAVFNAMPGKTYEIQSTIKQVV